MKRFLSTLRGNSSSESSFEKTAGGCVGGMCGGAEIQQGLVLVRVVARTELPGKPNLPPSPSPPPSIRSGVSSPSDAACAHSYPQGARAQRHQPAHQLRDRRHRLHHLPQHMVPR